MLGIERVIDEIAHYLRKDPLEIRRANFYDSKASVGKRSVTPYGMTVEDFVLDDIVCELVKTSEYAKRRQEFASGVSPKHIYKKSGCKQFTPKRSHCRSLGAGWGFLKTTGPRTGRFWPPKMERWGAKFKTGQMRSATDNHYG